MALAFARIAFTPKVQAAQARMGSRDAYLAADLGEPEIAELGEFEIEFIRARDSFYQGTVGENGWPYVQHRGGPPGFLKVLDARTIGYADFSGNRQYISVGNLEGDDRVMLFLMDYPGQRRLKIWGRARLVDEDAEPDLVARLESPDYRARVERGVLITVEAFDWNCPKYITPRFTERELRQRDARSSPEYLQAEPEAASTVPEATPTIAMTAPASGHETESSVLGSGPLKLVIAAVRQLTPRVRAYELRAPDWHELPPIAPGAHLVVPVRLADGSMESRQYSLAMHPRRRDRYEIAVLREAAGRGGSAAIHAGWRIGMQLALEPPANAFPLHEDSRPAVLIAGGIGITPIKAMAHALKARDTPFELHYGGRWSADMAYLDELIVEFPLQLHVHRSRESGGARMDLPAVLGSAPIDAVFYVCGPGGLIRAARAAAEALKIPAARVQFETFE